MLGLVYVCGCLLYTYIGVKLCTYYHAMKSLTTIEYYPRRVSTRVACQIRKILTNCTVHWHYVHHYGIESLLIQSPPIRRYWIEASHVNNSLGFLYTETEVTLLNHVETKSTQDHMYCINCTHFRALRTIYQASHTVPAKYHLQNICPSTYHARK